MAQRGGGNLKRDEKDPKPRKPGFGKLQLVRVEPIGKKGINLIFSQDGREHCWLLEHTSVTEFMALLLRGRMRQGRRIELEDAELMIEPPPEGSDHPQLCVAFGPLEVCVPVNRSAMKALRADLDCASERPR